MVLSVLNLRDVLKAKKEPYNDGIWMFYYQNQHTKMKALTLKKNHNKRYEYEK